MGRPVKVYAGYLDSSNVDQIESIVEMQHKACACGPFGKLWRQSRPRNKETDPVVWTEYQYDELGRTVKVTHTPVSGTTGNSGATAYDYDVKLVNGALRATAKVTDPAGRWKEHAVDGLGDLREVTEPKPAGGTYLTKYTYNAAHQLTRVEMTRDGFIGRVAQQVTQVRTFEYDPETLKLVKTVFPENGTTSYTWDRWNQTRPRRTGWGGWSLTREMRLGGWRRSSNRI